MTESLVWAHYLQDDQIAMRPPEERDAETPLRWHESLLPLTQGQALASLKASDSESTIRLIVGTITDGETVGGVRIDRHDHWVENLRITASRILPFEQQQDVDSRTLRIIVPWLIDEVAVSNISFLLANDRRQLCDTAEQLGFRRNATYRQHVHRPDGFVDLHLYQLLNPNWMFPRDPEAGHA